MMMWSGRPLHSQVIVVTGASSGIGLCTALLAAERGCKVVAIARSGAILDAVVQRIRQSCGRAVAFPADVADGMRMQQAAEHAVAQFGRIDTWINCAGVSVAGAIEDIVRLDHHRLFDTNFWGVVNGTLAAIPHVRAQNGAIVNLGCDLSATGPAMRGMYAVSKQAVKAFTRAFREDLSRDATASVSVSLIEPVSVDTPFVQHARNYLDSTLEAPLHPIHPVRVAEAILEAAVHGGHEIRVDIVPTAIRRESVRALLPRQLDGDQVEQNDADPSERASPPLGALYRPSASGRIRAGKRKDGEDR